MIFRQQKNQVLLQAAVERYLHLTITELVVSTSMPPDYKRWNVPDAMLLFGMLLFTVYSLQFCSLHIQVCFTKSCPIT